MKTEEYVVVLKREQIVVVLACLAIFLELLALCDPNFASFARDPTNHGFLPSFMDAYFTVPLSWGICTLLTSPDAPSSICLYLLYCCMLFQPYGIVFMYAAMAYPPIHLWFRLAAVGATNVVYYLVRFCCHGEDQKI